MNPVITIDDPRYVKAMSHPLRVRILAMLDERTASPVELAGWLGASLGTVAYNVHTLERIGLVLLDWYDSKGLDEAQALLIRIPTESDRPAFLPPRS
jgi:predicted transcriptional regulator